MKKLFNFALAILALCLSFSAHAQWSDNNVNNNQISEGYTWGDEFVVDKEGSSYFYYLQPETDLRIIPYLKKLDYNGNEVWKNPIRVSAYPTRTFTQINQLLAIDNESNIILVVCDKRLDSMNNENTLTAYKISPEGKMLWGENGVSITEGKSYDLAAVLNVIVLEDNSVVFAYQCGEGTTEEDMTSKIRMQRVLSDGSIKWQGKNISEEGVSIQYPYAANAGNNEFYLLYTKGTTPEICMQKFDFDGNPMWSKPTLVYGLGGFGNAGAMQTILDVKPAKDGVMVLWNDDRGGTNQETVHIAYIGKDGQHKFTTADEGTRVCYSDLRQFVPQAVYDMANDVIGIAFTETIGGQQQRKVTFQLMSSAGELLLAPEGVDVCPLLSHQAGQHTIELGPKGSFCVFYMTQEDATHTVLQASLFDNKGKKMWKEGSVKLTDGAHSQSSTQSSPLVKDQWVVSFSDNRKTGKLSNSHVYAQNIKVDGTLGVSTSNEKAIGGQVEGNIVVYPNPVKEMFNIKILDGTVNEQVKIVLYNMLGVEIGVLYNGSANGNISIERPNSIEKGVYLLKATINGREAGTKVVLQ